MPDLRARIDQLPEFVDRAVLEKRYWRLFDLWQDGLSAEKLGLRHQFREETLKGGFGRYMTTQRAHLRDEDLAQMRKTADTRNDDTPRPKTKRDKKAWELTHILNALGPHEVSFKQMLSQLSRGRDALEDSAAKSLTKFNRDHAFFDTMLTNLEGMAARRRERELIEGISGGVVGDFDIELLGDEPECEAEGKDVRTELQDAKKAFEADADIAEALTDTVSALETGDFIEVEMVHDVEIFESITAVIEANGSEEEAASVQDAKELACKKPPNRMQSSKRPSLRR